MLLASTITGSDSKGSNLERLGLEVNNYIAHLSPLAEEFSERGMSPRLGNKLIKGAIPLLRVMYQNSVLYTRLTPRNPLHIEMRNPELKGYWEELKGQLGKFIEMMLNNGSINQGSILLKIEDVLPILRDIDHYIRNH